MSFWPLAKSSRERARALAGHGRVVELGAGAGAFATRLASLDLDPLLIDPLPFPGPAGLPRVRAASPELPLATASCGLLVLANTLRQLEVARWVEHAREWRRCLAPGGELWVLEDDPRDERPAARNYHRCLELLAATSPGRGAALDVARVREGLDPSFGPPVHAEEGENATVVHDPHEPLRWLRARATRADRELDGLEARVAAEGMAYGRFWLRAWQR